MQFANMFLGLSITEKTKYIAYIYSLGLIVSIAANILLIPQIGIMGAAITGSLVAVIILFIQIHLSQKHFYVEIKFSPYIATALIAVVLISITLIVPVKNSVIFYIVKGAMVVVYPIVCIRVTKIVRFTEIINFCKKNH